MKLKFCFLRIFELELVPIGEVGFILYLCSQHTVINAILELCVIRCIMMYHYQRLFGHFIFVNYTRVLKTYGRMV
jgi:hypothetical protein